LNNFNSKPKWRFLAAAGVALTLIIYLGGVAWSAFGPSRWISYKTRIGGYENVTLADGSRIQLNTDTEMKVRITPEKQEVQLVRGEALIDVAPDAHRGFTLRAGSTAVQANQSGGNGAAFVVRRWGHNGIDVAVAKGTVVLGRSSSLSSIVEEGELANVRSDGVHLMRFGVEELKRKLSWTTGLLTFKGESLEEVANEFNRYNRKHLVVVDPRIAGRKIGGAFHATDPDSFVSALQKWFDVRADEEPLADGDGAVVRLTKAN
jgi:transmembrane sensor